MFRVRILAAATVVCALAPAPAGAAPSTVDVDQGVIRLVGSNQEDDVGISYDSGSAVFRGLLGTELRPGAGCAGAGVTEVRCAAPPGTRIVASLGEGSDNVKVAPEARDALRLEADGGPGDDRLEGADAPDVLVGGAGGDDLHGNGGDDVLDLQDGDDDAGHSDCGGGNDLLKIDPPALAYDSYAGDQQLDYRVKDCERVEVAPLPALVKVEFDKVVFQDVDGGRNDVTVAREGPGVRVTDAVAITARANCANDRPGDARTAYCTGADGVEIKLGGGDDRLRVIGPLSFGDLGVDAHDLNVDAGAGNDVVVDGADSAYIDGGPGNDTLADGPGDDVVHGSAGNDVLTGGTGFDRFDGDEGADRLDTRDGSIGPTINGFKGQGESVSCGFDPGESPTRPKRVVDVLVADVGDFVRSCERLTYKDTAPTAPGALQILGPSKLTLPVTGKAVVRIPVKCVGGPCRGRLFAYTSPVDAKTYDPSTSDPFASRDTLTEDKYSIQLAPGRSQNVVLPFYGGYRFKRFRLGLAGKRMRMYLATLVGDDAGHTKTVRRTTTLVGPKGLK
jgi:Ca2+-binding RTX toxin-like protein